MDEGVGCPPIGMGVKREGPKKLQEVGNLLGYLTAGGKLFLLCKSGTVVLLLTGAASAPWGPSHAGPGTPHTRQ